MSLPLDAEAVTVWQQGLRNWSQKEAGGIIPKWIGIIGSYLLMMFYTTVGGWMMYYCFRSVRGDFVGAYAGCGRGWVCRYAGKSGDADDVDRIDLCNWICGMLVWNSKRN